MLVLTISTTKPLTIVDAETGRVITIHLEPDGRNTRVAVDADQNFRIHRDPIAAEQELEDWYPPDDLGTP